MSNTLGNQLEKKPQEIKKKYNRQIYSRKIKEGMNTSSDLLFLLLWVLKRVGGQPSGHCCAPAPAGSKWDEKGAMRRKLTAQGGGGEALSI